MAITNFQQTIWSKKFNQALPTITSLRNHCDFKWEKESKNAKEVKILNAVRPTIRTYVPGTPLVREAATDGSMLLKLDQFRYYDYEVEDIDQAQSVDGLMDVLAEEAGRGLTEEGDKYVASLVKAGVEAQTNPLAQSASVITLTKSNVVRSIEDGFAVLYGNNCRVNDTYYLEVGPKEITHVKEALTELSTDNPEILKKGAVGKYSNAYVCMENLLPTGKSSASEATDDVRYNILRTNKAIAFAEQIDKVEAFRPHDGFTDAVKALYVFGAKIVRPDEIYVMKTAIA